MSAPAGGYPVVRHEPEEPHERPPASNGAQWAGALAGPVTYLLNHELMYVLVSPTCVHGGRWALHLSSLVAFALALGGAALARRTWRLAGDEAPGPEGGSVARTRFMGALGVVMSLGFAVFIIAQWMPVAMLNACEKSG